MATQPIAGNQNYTKVDNTIVSSNAVLNAEQSGGLAQLKEVQGTFTPTAAGNYAVTDVDGNNVTLPTGALIVSLVMSSDVALAGGTSVQASLGVTAGTSTTTQTAAIANASVNAGMNVPTTVATGVVAGATWLTGVTVGVNTAGVVRFRVVYQETSPV